MSCPNCGAPDSRLEYRAAVKPDRHYPGDAEGYECFSCGEFYSPAELEQLQADQPPEEGLS